MDSTVDLRKSWSILLVNQSIALLISGLMMDFGRTMQRMAIAILVINGILYLATRRAATMERKQAVARWGIVITWVIFLSLCITLGMGSWDKERSWHRAGDLADAKSAAWRTTIR